MTYENVYGIPITYVDTDDGWPFHDIEFDHYVSNVLAVIWNSVQRGASQVVSFGGGIVLRCHPCMAEQQYSQPAVHVEPVLVI